MYQKDTCLLLTEIRPNLAALMQLCILSKYRVRTLDLFCHLFKRNHLSRVSVRQQHVFVAGDSGYLNRQQKFLIITLHPRINLAAQINLEKPKLSI